MDEFHLLNPRSASFGCQYALLPSCRGISMIVENAAFMFATHLNWHQCRNLQSHAIPVKSKRDDTKPAICLSLHVDKIVSKAPSSGPAMHWTRALYLVPVGLNIVKYEFSGTKFLSDLKIRCNVWCRILNKATLRAMKSSYKIILQCGINCVVPA